MAWLGRVGGMAPQARGVLPPETIAAIKAAQAEAASADRALREVVVQALVDGASYPEVQKATGIAMSTQQRWVRELGATPAKKSPRARDELFRQRISAMHLND